MSQKKSDFVEILESVRDATAIMLLEKTLSEGGTIAIPGTEIIIGLLSPEQQEELRQKLKSK